MSKFKSLGMKVQELCQVYEIRHADEQQDDDDDEPEIINTQRHPTRSLTYHMLFTLAIFTTTILLAIIVEHERELNTYWQLCLSILEMFKEFIFKESSVLAFLKSQNPGEKVFTILTAIHVAVYLAWDITQRKHSIMLKYFVINEDKSNSIWAHLFSAFSHVSAWNLIANTAYLYPLCTSGFIQTWPSLIGMKFSHYMEIEEFFVLYISACVFSSMSKIYIERKFNVLPEDKQGASGAISAIFGYVAWACPNKPLSMPMFKTSLEIHAFQALLCLLFMVVVICVKQKRSWTNIMTIVTGCVFGIFWYKYMSKHLWANRKLVTNEWIALKNFVRRQIFKCNKYNKKIVK